MATKTKRSETNGSAGATVEVIEGIGAAESVRVTAPNWKFGQFPIIGDVPYVQLNFGEKSRNVLRATHAAGSTARKGKKREAKDFDALFVAAQHVSQEGWNGIPASAFLHAMVDACTLIDFHKTKAKKTVRIVADGFDKCGGEPLVRIYGPPKHVEHTVRNANGQPDIRVRAMFDAGWTANVRIGFDADMFTLTDVTNLLMRAGMQVGIGEGRPSSKNGIGMGWGTFNIARTES